jgi:putative membrane-bound dehydrogenase-like protein
MKKIFSFLSLSVLSVSLLAAPAGTLPVGRDGKPLNLDFETGTLKDWTATGTAFDAQPNQGDTVAARRSDMKSNQRGLFWVGTYEVAGDKPQGTLTSAPFKVTQPYASFLVGGGSLPGTRVELVRADNQQVFFKVSGNDSENMHPAVVDLQKLQGVEIFIRLVDEESGGWGHINFDDFRFYAGKPAYPDQVDPNAQAAHAMPAADVFQYNGVSPEEAVKIMTLPPGFKAQLFAGEPDVKQPIAFAIDDRGRIWVAEGYTYPQRAPEGQGKDRILVFEDTNGDGKFDKRTVFMEGLNLVSGLEVGFGGVWVGAAPYLMFIPMTDGDTPKPAGPPQILLDGWGYQDTHETLNTFTWGPDGWLYGCHGVFNLAKVGKPGTPDKERTVVTCGVWRYHPTKKVFEYFSEGTSNPWGVDFDEHGQCIIEACVIPHLWQMVQGGHFERQGGQHVNPYVFDDIKTIADHVHYAGDKGPHAANGRSASMGGGHAHAGLMVYQGHSWPKEYWGQYYMNNIHGACINEDSPEPAGSSMIGHHHANFIDFNDSWSQIINLQSDQDGSMYMIDWYDRNQCHNTDPNATDRSNGRIFKIVYGDTKTTQVDLQKMSDAQLAALQAHPNVWYSRHARRILQERAQTKPISEDARRILLFYLNPLDQAMRVKTPDYGGSIPKGILELHALWTLHVTGGVPKEIALKLLDKGNPWVRAWSIQLLAEDKNITVEVLSEFLRMADDPSPTVRLYLASALQRIPVNERWAAVADLDAHGEDANDHNLPLMYWYAAEPLPGKDIDRALKMAETARIPRMLQFTVRRTAALGTPEAFAAITASLNRVTSNARILDILTGLSLALKGQRHAAMPAGWNDAEAKLNNSPGAEIRAQVQSLSLIFGSTNALTALRKTLSDESADVGARRTALDSLLAAHDPNLAPLLQAVLDNAGLQGPALRGLAAYDSTNTPAAILALYPKMGADNRRDALTTLASRLPYAKALMAAVAANTVPVKDLSADIIRQLRRFKDEQMEKDILRLWGVSRDSSAELKKEIERIKNVYRAGGSQPGDASRGRAVFARTCQQCHTLFGTGGKVGPDLTGSARADLDYITLNVVDPNAIIPNDYRAWNIDMKDGRNITGIVTKQDDKAVTVVMPNETLVLPRGEIESLQQSALSMMPEGLLTPLSDQEVRDLLYYLSRPGQVPLPATNAAPAAAPAPAKSAPPAASTISTDPAAFFNGKDLSAWDGDMSLWRVENGEIVGSTATGLKHNEFLKSRMVLSDFRLVLKIKLTPNKENSGVQFRSERFGDYEMKGPQADVGLGWWGKLYEENGRAILSNNPGDPYVNQDGWNTYEIVAVGSKVRTAINGHLCVDIDDLKISRSGIIGLQMHAGGPMEVRFKDLHLELSPKFELTTLKQP